MGRARAWILALALLVVWPAALRADWNSNLELPSAAPLVDEANLLQPAEREELSALLRRIKAGSGVEISVYIASSLRERPIEEFSLAVAERWGLGTKKVDKGLLFLVAPNERQMRFEVGYGLEGDITDAFSRRVLDNRVRPFFRDGQYYEGIRAAIGGIQEKVPLGLSENEVPRPEPRRGPSSLFSLLFVLFIIIAAVMRILGGGGGRRYGGPIIFPGGGGGGWGGGGGGGGWGGGGGGFGGGGSSSNW